MPTIDDFRTALASHPPRLATRTEKTPAAVAIIFHDRADESHLLFIERTRQEGDPWSGHIAFPGGRLEEEDADLRAAAERETMEEVGLCLDAAEYLGRLDDLTGSTLPVQVAGFAYCVEEFAALAPNGEVQEAFWVPIGHLLDPERHLEKQFPFRGLENRILPAIDILGPDRPVLWGITYRFVSQLFALAGYPLPGAGGEL
ncbi:MAG: CoA pyrophosphatase [Gemmatimonadetes bacterium]|jgi:8-oxo-dGTP pyrophosphatase MutT (NUDIX family)|nr:CoA pyrophosphatase [Gemmatimonadota bacterium]